jgi:uncharacterized damage-inducible protein DinB
METLPETTLAELIRYNNWANQQVLAACETLSDEQLDATLPGSYGTVRQTLEHIIRAEAFYVSILTGQRPLPPFQWDAKPGLAEMRAYAVQVGEALVDAIGRIGPNDLVYEEEEGNKFHYQAVVVFIQIINHGVEHRTNITTILSAAQQTPPGVDGWSYLSAYPERFHYEYE